MGSPARPMEVATEKIQAHIEDGSGPQEKMIQNVSLTYKHPRNPTSPKQNRPNPTLDPSRWKPSLVHEPGHQTVGSVGLGCQPLFLSPLYRNSPQELGRNIRDLTIPNHQMQHEGRLAGIRKMSRSLHHPRKKGWRLLNSPTESHEVSVLEYL